MLPVKLLRDNVRRARERIAVAAQRVGREPDEVTLLAATKTRSVEEIAAVIEAGVEEVGENYVQEARAKFVHLGPRVRWHMIGHLQRNKVKAALEIFEVIQSVDSLRLAREISKRAQRQGREVPILIEVKTGGEETKFGVEPAAAAELVEQIAPLEGLRVEGLMTMPPPCADPEEVRPFFRQLRQLAEEIEKLALPRVRMWHLSMGMSQDFEVAIEEGATIVRLGTVLFGPRQE
ncbi:MAG TPA: YggS family pyridoxal phosphate-dependent enzyme [Armatimonadetes bacterium]|nr:YggS family pyridoxal phosphate-dependent enzyme [Armatimonadota bacterium]